MTRPAVSCPAPRSPTRPTICPRATSKDTGPTPVAVRFSTVSRGSPTCAVGRTKSRQRPAHDVVDKLRRVGGGDALGDDTAAVAQHRNPVGAAEHLVEPVRHVDRSLRRPARRRRRASSSIATSVSGRAAVGSSRISTSDLRAMARAVADDRLRRGRQVGDARPGVDAAAPAAPAPSPRPPAPPPEITPRRRGYPVMIATFSATVIVSTSPNPGG